MILIFSTHFMLIISRDKSTYCVRNCNITPSLEQKLKEETAELRAARRPLSSPTFVDESGTTGLRQLRKGERRRKQEAHWDPHSLQAGKNSIQEPNHGNTINT